MSYAKHLISLATLACLAALGGTSAKAQEIKTVFVIAMEKLPFSYRQVELGLRVTF